MTADRQFEAIHQELRERGIESAIRKLNAMTSCRYTAIYRFEGDWLRNLLFFDRMAGFVDPPDDVPVEASYCVFVRRECRDFLVEDSWQDVRVASHPKQKSIRTYYGAPITNTDGHTVGTICHFDIDAVPLTPEVIAFTEEFARDLGKPRIVKLN